MANWDNEIDDVAQQMTAGEPDAGFKSHVLARIEADHGPQRRGWSMWAWPAVALAASAVLALVIVRSPWQAGDMTVRLKPDPTYEPKPDTTVESDSGPTSAGQADVASAFRRTGAGQVDVASASGPTSAGQADVASAFRRTNPGQVNVASAFGRTNAGQIDDVGIETSDLTPLPIEIEPIGLESMEGTELIQVPALAIAQLEVPTVGAE